MRVSTVGVTMLDVAADLGISGGLDNAATAIAELAWENDGFMDDVLAAAPPIPPLPPEDSGGS